MLSDEGSNVVTKPVEILSQSFIEIIKELLAQLLDVLLFNPIKNHQELRKDLKRTKKMSKEAEKLERENNCGYRDKEGELIPLNEMLKNKNELSNVELSYSYDRNGNPLKLEAIYELDDNGNRIYKTDENGKPLIKKIALTDHEELISRTYLNDLKKLAKERGVLCAINDEGIDLNGDGLYHNSLVFRTKDSLNLNSLIATLDVVTALRKTLYEAGIDNAYNISIQETLDLIEINKTPYDMQLALNRIQEQYKKNIHEKSTLFNGQRISENKLTSFIENSKLKEIKNVIEEQYGSIQEYYNEHLDKKSVVDVIKKSVEKEFANDNVNKHFFHLYSDKENKLIFNDASGGFHLLDLKGFEEIHFKDSKEFISYFINDYKTFEITNIKEENIIKMEQLLKNISSEELNNHIENYLEEINNVYEEKTKLAEMKFKDTDLVSDEMAWKAVIQFEIDNNDSIVLSSSKNYLDLNFYIEMESMDRYRLINSGMDMHTLYITKNILDLQEKYEFLIPDNVKELICKSELDGQKIPLISKVKLLNEALEDPLILKDKITCEIIINEGINTNNKNLYNAFRIEDNLNKESVYLDLSMAQADLVNDSPNIQAKLEDLESQLKDMHNFDSNFENEFEKSGIIINGEKVINPLNKFEENPTYYITQNKEIIIEFKIQENYKEIKEDFSKIYDSLPTAYQDFKLLNSSQNKNILVDEKGNMKIQIVNPSSTRNEQNKDLFKDNKRTNSINDTVKKCENIYDKYANNKVKIPQKDITMLRKNLKILKTHNPKLYKNINLNRKIVNAIKSSKER